MLAQQAAKLHEKALVVDALSFPYIMDEPHLSQVKKGGVDAAVITAAISQDFPQAVLAINALLKRIDGHPEICLATTAEAVRQAKENGQLALIFGFQDIAPVENDLSRMHLFHKLGVRIMQLTYTGGNLAGDGCGERTDCGLRYFGLDAVEEMNRLGLAIDLSHCGDATTEEAIRRSKAPVMFTHSNCRSLCNNRRNKTDGQIRMLADKGGYMGLTPHPALVCQGKKPDLEAFLDHVDHLAAQVGTDHIGLGLDYVAGLKSASAIPESVITWRTRRPDIFGTLDDFFNLDFTCGLESIDKLSSFTEGLLRRGYTETAVEKILGGNFLRVFQEIAG